MASNSILESQQQLQSSTCSLFVIWVSIQESLQNPLQNRPTLQWLRLHHYFPFFLQSKLLFLWPRWFQRLYLLSRSGDTTYLQDGFSKSRISGALGKVIPLPWPPHRHCYEYLRLFWQILHNPRYSQFSHQHLLWNHHYPLSLFPLSWLMWVTQVAQVPYLLLFTPMGLVHPFSDSISYLHLLKPPKIHYQYQQKSLFLQSPNFFSSPSCSEGSLGLLRGHCFLCSSPKSGLFFSPIPQWSRCPPCSSLLFPDHSASLLPKTVQLWVGC